MSMRINIHKTDAVLGIDIQQAQLKVLRSRQLRMDIEQQNASMQIEWNRPQVKFDSSAAYAGASVPNITGTQAAATPQISHAAYAKTDSHSRAASDKHKKVTPMQSAMNKAAAAHIRRKRSEGADEARETSRTKIEPGFYTIKYHGGSIDINVEEIPGEVEFQNYSVNIYLEQEPSIEITVDEYLDELVAVQKVPMGQYIDKAL